MSVPSLPQIVYGTFAGGIDQASLPRIFNALANATNAGVRSIHLLFQSNGGNVGDGISLYNYLLTVPLEVHLYNTGHVQSIAVLPYLAAKRRIVSKSGSFLIHKSQYSLPPYSNVPKIKAAVDVLVNDDARSEAILRVHTHIPAEQWALHATMQDITFDAQQAVDFGIADEIGEFKIPPGNQVFNV